MLNELKTYDPSLLEKSIWIALNKKDTLDDDKENELIAILHKAVNKAQTQFKGIVSMSGFTGEKTSQLLGMIANEMMGG